MRYAPLEELKGQATIGLAPSKPMSRRERLCRWAAVLEQDPERQLRPLSRIELYAQRDRDLLRRDESPLSVAFADPVLRGEGLAGDRHGDARTFFRLSPPDLHYVVCDCRYGREARAGDVAKRIRRLATGGWLQRAVIWLSA